MILNNKTKLNWWDWWRDGPKNLKPEDYLGSREDIQTSTNKESDVYEPPSHHITIFPLNYNQIKFTQPHNYVTIDKILFYMKT